MIVSVIPAQAEILFLTHWIPACAGMTEDETTGMTEPEKQGVTTCESATYLIRHNGETRTSTPSENVT